ncbi:MAG: hypothetical protein KJO95_08410 [Gammaproteobacteria bacterium]|nr:hypothetical protein [Gammaproteobacteria bacterium]
MDPSLDINDAIENINALERQREERIPKLNWCVIEPDIADQGVETNR